MKARGLASPDVADALALTFAAPVMPLNANLPAHLQHDLQPDGTELRNPPGALGPAGTRAINEGLQPV
jgi:hypothetical protein